MRTSIILVITVLTLCIYTCVSGDITYKGTIIFDTSTGFFGIGDESPVGLSCLRDELEYEGYNLSESPVGLNRLKELKKVNTVTQDLINKIPTLVLINPNRGFEREKISLIKDFVVEGGKLLLISDIPESLINMNKLSKRFGAEFLSYYLGDEIKIEASSGEVYFISPIPLTLEEEPEVLLKTDFIEAKEWKTLWERPEKEVRKANFTVFAGIRYGKGSVALLGDKDILLNKNIKKGNNLDFALSIFDWFEHKKPDDTIAYSTDKLNFFVKKGKTSTAILAIKNKGDVEQTLKFEVPFYLKGIVSVGVNGDGIKIKPGETKVMAVKVNWAEDSSSVTGFIVVEREFGFYRTADYIKLEMVQGEI